MLSENTEAHPESSTTPVSNATLQVTQNISTRIWRIIGRSIGISINALIVKHAVDTIIKIPNFNWGRLQEPYYPPILYWLSGAMIFVASRVLLTQLDKVLAEGKPLLTQLDKVLAERSGKEPIVSKLSRRRNPINTEKLSLNRLYKGKLLPGKSLGLSWYSCVSNRTAKDIDKIQDEISELLLFYPSELLQQHVSAIIMQEYPVSSMEAGGALRAKKKFYVRVNTTLSMRSIVHHEMVHMIFLHGVIERFAKDWKEQFWENSEDQSTYAPGLMQDGKNYGSTNANEDMATVGEYLFSQNWWGILRRAIENNNLWDNPWVLETKVARLLELFDKQSKWKMNKEYFQFISMGVIKTGEDAQRYFQELEK
jgi:hypothetical protein